VPFLILIFLATGLVGYLSYRNAQQTVRDIVNQLRSEIDGRIQDHLRTFLEIPPRINQINANAIRQGWLKTNDPNRMERYFREQLQVYNSVTSIYFGNVKGGLTNAGREGGKGSQYVMVTDGFAKGRLHKYALDKLGNRVKLLTTIPFFDATVRSWYTGAVKMGDDTWSEIYPLITGQDMAIAASRPVYDNQHNLLGVVSVDIFLSQLSGFLKTLDIGKTGISFIMERSGLLIASSTDENPLTGYSGAANQERLDSHKSAIPLIRHAAEVITGRFGNYYSINKAQNFDYSINGQFYFLRVSPFQTNNGLNWLIITVMPESDFMAQINVNNRNTALLIGSILIFVIILCIITAQLITIPILHLNTATQSLAKGNWAEIHTVQWLRETGDLTLSFNHMIRQLKQTMGNLTSEVEERKRTEEALRESEELFRVSMERAPDGVYMNNLEGNFLYGNRKAEEIIGYQSEELIGRNFLDFNIIAEGSLGKVAELLK
jgi:PAS domain-containing protein